MSEFVKEGAYVIAESSGEGLYIFMEAKKDDPLKPRIIYDGNDHALFYRNDEQKIILDYINPEVRNKLRKAFQVTIVETILDNIKDSYYVDIEMVNQLPINVEEYGLTNWEEMSLNA